MAAPVVERDAAEGLVASGVLLVDDQPANLVALKAMLEGISPHIVTAGSGREARATTNVRARSAVRAAVESLPPRSLQASVVQVRTREEALHLMNLFWQRLPE